MSLRDQIKDCVTKAAPVVLAVPTPELPELDGQIHVTRVSPRAMSKCWQDSADENQIDERARFVVLVAADSAGSRIFQDNDVLWLSTCELLAPMVERLYWAGREVNGLTEENRTAWRKNSSGTAEGGSPSSCAALSQQGTDSTSTAS